MPETITPAESRDFRQLRRVYAWVLAIAFPVIWVCQYLPEAGLVLAFIYLAAVFLIALPVTFWPCPRCRRHYATRFWPIGICWPWIDECLHCGAVLAKDDSPTAH